MKVILLGATGMVGQGVLRECLRDPAVEQVLTLGRSTTGQKHEKLIELIHKNFFDFSSIEHELTGYDACFFCLGTSSAGMSEQEYRRITYDLTMAAAGTLARCNPGMTFIYVSGAGTDSTGTGRMMWARVKGETENALLELPFRAAYMFRPGYIQPLHGIVPKTRWLKRFYDMVGPLYPLWKRLLPGYVTTSEQMGRAMLHAARHGARKHVLENRDINELCPPPPLPGL